MTADRRDGIDRRDEISDPITLGEVYRLLLAVDNRTKEMQKDADTESHSLRKTIGQQSIEIALLQKELESVKAKQSEWRQWIAALVVGGVVMLLQLFLPHGVAR